MKYIKLKCNSYDCKTEFLVAMNDWYIKEYDEVIHDYYLCPMCSCTVWTENNSVIEIP